MDIGIGGRYRTKYNLGLSLETLEMKVFINRNYGLMDWNKIVSISKDDLERFMPERPSIPFVPIVDEEEEDENN